MQSNLKNTFTTIAAVVVVLFLVWVALNKNNIPRKNLSKSVAENQEVPEADVVKLLKDSLVISTISKNFSNFALRLADFYNEKSRYDSAARYFELAAQRVPNEENWVRAGLTYYKAFENASDGKEEKRLALKGMECLEQGITTTTSPKIKRKLAELYLANEKPNEAVDLLKQVIASDPSDKQTLYFMGIHAFQLNDYKDATHFLGRLANLDSTHVNGLYFLAISEMKLGNISEAKMLFEKVKQLDSSEEVQADVDAYLNDIK